jgi:hypothetical protein
VRLVFCVLTTKGHGAQTNFTDLNIGVGKGGIFHENVLLEQRLIIN